MKTNSRSVAAAAVIGAAYAVLTMALAPISYGPIQLRLSEALCIMPFFLPSCAWGLFVGCALANIVTGNIFDIIFGALATLLAGFITARAGKMKPAFGSRFLACSAPVVINAIVIGAVITSAYNGFDPIKNIEVFALNAVQIAAGEAIVMYLVGLPLMHYLPGRRFFREYIEKANKEG